MANVYGIVFPNNIARILQEDLKDKVNNLTEENHALLSTFKELQGKFREKGGERDLAVQRLNE